MTLTDHRGTPITVGARVIPISWGTGIPLWLSNTKGTVTAVGPKRISIHFDGVTYGSNDRPHRTHPAALRVIAP